MADPVLIVGAGPTGLTAALELSRFGIPVRLVERLRAPATTSRALGIQARTLELMEMRGLAAELVRRGKPVGGIALFGGGERLARIDLAGIPSPYPFVLILPQSETEAVLRDALAARGVAVEHGTELVAIAQGDGRHGGSPVTAVLRRAGGALEEASAPWLIGAEGAHSLVRQTLSLPFEGETRPEHYLLGDVTVEGDLAADETSVFTSQDGLLVMFPYGGKRFRMVASRPAPADGAPGPDPSLADLQSAYDARSPVPGRLGALTWSAWFRINSRMVERLRVGRLLIGGDAAHIHSPAGGQGMNTGIQDMIDLAWKLALVMRGEAPDALLDSYEAERLPVMRDVLGKTEALTDAVGTRNPVLRGLIRHLAPWIVGAHGIQALAAARVSQTTIHYRGSPLSEQHGRAGALRAGDRVPDMAVRHRDGAAGSGDGADEWRDGRLLPLIDPGRFTLLVAGEDEAAPGAAAARPWAGLVAVRGLAAPAEPGAAAAFRDRFGAAGGLLLVRPDGYVAFAGGPGSAAALAGWCGRWLGARGLDRGGATP